MCETTTTTTTTATATTKVLTSKVNDKQPDHAHGSPAGGRLLVEAVDVPGQDDGDDEVARGHADGADDEDGLPAHAVNPQHGGDGGDEHDNTDHTRREQADGRGAEAELPEDLGSVVENLEGSHRQQREPCPQEPPLFIQPKTHSIDGSPLLEEHRNRGNNNTLEHGLGLEQPGDGHKLQLKDVPGSLLAQVGELLGDAALLEQRLCLDLEELELDELVVRGEVSEVGEHGTGLLLAPVVEQPARGEGHPEHADEEDHRGAELDADGDEPGGVGLGLHGGAADVVGATDALC